MYPSSEQHLDHYLDHLIRQAEQIRGLDLAEEADLEEALATTQRMMGALALYRDRLQRIEAPGVDESSTWELPQAA